MFKIRKYYIIYIQNEKNIDVNMSKVLTKNTLIYEKFD